MHHFLWLVVFFTMCELCSVAWTQVHSTHFVSDCRNLESLKSRAAVSAVSRGKRKSCLQCKRRWLLNRPQCRFHYSSSFIASESTFTFTQQKQQQRSAATAFLTGHVVASGWSRCNSDQNHLNVLGLRQPDTWTNRFQVCRVTNILKPADKTCHTTPPMWPSGKDWGLRLHLWKYKDNNVKYLWLL